MKARGWVLMATCVVVAGLGAAFAFTHWGQADKIATMASALGAVAAVGIAVWAALFGKASTGAALVMRASRTGTATARTHGEAITGIQAPAEQLAGRIEIDRTGDAVGSGGGTAATGIQLR